MNKNRILLVEDDQMIREMYSRTLKNAGFEVTEIDDGQVAYDEMNKLGKYDLVLLDIMIPHISGLDILKKNKEKLDFKQDYKVIMLTNLDKDTMVYDSLTHGAEGYLVKDQVNLQELVSEVRRHLQ